MLYNHLCNKYGENRIVGAYALVYRIISSTVEGETNMSSVLLIQLAACGGEIFSKSTVVQTKISLVSKTTPLLGVICHHFGKT